MLLSRILNVTANNLPVLPESIAHCSLVLVFYCKCLNSFYFCPDISKILFGIDSILRPLVKQDASFNNLPSLPTNIGYGTQNLERLSIHLKKHRYFLASVTKCLF